MIKYVAFLRGINVGGNTNAFFEKELGVSATTRNWTTVTEILELAEKA